VEVRFSIPVQASPEAHPSSHKMGTPSVFRGIRWPENGADHPSPCKVDTVNGPELHFSLPSVPYTGMSCGDLYIYPLLLYEYSPYNFEVSHGRAVCSVSRNIK